MSGEILNEDLKMSLNKNFKRLEGQNINFIDEKEVENTLRKDVRIKKISIKKRYPSTLEVLIEERKPHVYVKKGNVLYLADRELNLFGYVYELTKGSVPIVTFSNAEEENEIKEILKNMQSKELYNVVSEIRKKDDKYQLILLNGIKIITDGNVKEDKYDKVIKLYEKIKYTEPVNYIDIRFKNINVK